MKELKSIEEIKDRILYSKGKLVMHWSVKTGFFGGIDEKTINDISKFKDLINEGTYIPLIKFSDDYILMDLKSFTKTIKKNGIKVNIDLKNYSSEDKKAILRMCVNRMVQESSIKFACYYKLGLW